MQRVNKDLIENSVLQIFVDYQIPAGGRLPFSDLRETWPSNNLRQSDLVEGLKQLVFSAQLDLEDEAAGPMLVLTPAGYQRARKLPALRSRSVLRHFLGGSVFSFKRRPVTGRRASDGAMTAMA